MEPREDELSLTDPAPLQRLLGSFRSTEASICLQSARREEGPIESRTENVDSRDVVDFRDGKHHRIGQEHVPADWHGNGSIDASGRKIWVQGEGETPGHKFESGASLQSEEPQWLKVTSPCSGSMLRWAEPNRRRWHDSEDTVKWNGFCSCCKRPLSIELAERPAKRMRFVEGPFAYVVAIWGSKPSYVLSAMVLGHSLRRTGTKHDLICLHTKDVPSAALEFLRQAGWQPRQVEYVPACESLYQETCLKTRFADVFTKLRVFSLTEYSKVVMMDADMLVQDNIDDLFDLPAPAAMTRGPSSGYSHGDRIQGQYFFGGSRPGHWSWGQSSGINAGVMVLEPSEETSQQCLAEVADSSHPEHVRGNGPEQDYLSRFFASEWSQVDVAYNFQLHQMYFALSPTCMKAADRTAFFGKPEKVKVFHYSSEPKPWARKLESRYASWTDAAWLHEVQSNFSGFQAWVLKDPDYVEREGGRDGVALGPDGLLHLTLEWQTEWATEDSVCFASTNEGKKSGCVEKLLDDGREHTAETPLGGGALPCPPLVSDSGELLGRVVEVPADAIDGAELVTKAAIQQWEATYDELAQMIGETELATAVSAACIVDKEDATTAAGWTGGASHVESFGGNWSRHGGWWRQWPADGRLATARCSVQPLFAQLSFNGYVLLEASCAGVHVAAGGAEGCPAPRTLVGPADALEWGEAVPDGAVVLLACIDCDGSDSSAILEVLGNGGMGCPSAVLPSSCSVAAALGRKGKAQWTNTHAAPDTALVSLYM